MAVQSGEPSIFQRYAEGAQGRDLVGESSSHDVAHHGKIIFEKK